MTNKPPLMITGFLMGIDTLIFNREPEVRDTVYYGAEGIEYVYGYVTDLQWQLSADNPFGVDADITIVTPRGSSAQTIWRDFKFIVRSTPPPPLLSFPDVSQL